MLSFFVVEDPELVEGSGQAESNCRHTHPTCGFATKWQAMREYYRCTTARFLKFYLVHYTLCGS